MEKAKEIEVADTQSPSNIKNKRERKSQGDKVALEVQKRLQRNKTRPRQRDRNKKQPKLTQELLHHFTAENIKEKQKQGYNLLEHTIKEGKVMNNILEAHQIKPGST